MIRRHRRTSAHPFPHPPGSHSPCPRTCALSARFSPRRHFAAGAVWLAAVPHWQHHRAGGRTLRLCGICGYGEGIWAMRVAGNRV